MSGDFEPVEIRLDLIQNVDSEGEKSTAAMNEIAAASNKMKAQFEKDIAAQKTLTTQLINELKLLKETMGKKVDTGDEKQIVDKQKLAEQIDLLNKKLTEQEALLNRIGKTPTTSPLPKLNTDVDAYARQVRGLNMSMTQIMREAPNFAISPMIGIMSLSNNLPMLQGDISRMIELNKQLKESGQATIPVWKQLGSTLLSWQMALIGGISALMIFGPQIGDFISKMFNFRDATRLSKDEVNALNESFAKAAGSDLGKLKTQFDALNNAKKGTDEYYDSKKRIIDQYGGYLNGMDSEIASLNNVKGAYQALTVEIIKAAKAKALQETNSSLASDFLAKSGDQYDTIQTNFIEKYGKDLGKMRFDMFKKQLESGGGFTTEMQHYIAEFNKTQLVGGGAFAVGAGVQGQRDETTNIIVTKIEEFKQAKKEFDQKTKEAWDRFGDTSETAVKNSVAVIDERIQALKTEQKQVSDNKAKWDEYQKQIDGLEKKKEAITGPKDKKTSGDKEKIERSMIEVSKEYLDIQDQIIRKEKELTAAILSGNTDLGIKITKDIDALQKQMNEMVESPTIQPIKANLAATPVDTKTLKAMKQLTDEERKQLDILSKKLGLNATDLDQLEDEAKLREEIAGYALQLVDALTQSMDLTESQVAELNSAANAISQLGQGNYVGAAISAISAGATAVMDTSGLEDKLSKPWEEYESWITRSNDALERYIKLRDDAIGSERYTTSDQAINEAKNIKAEAEAKLNGMKLSWTFVDKGWFKGTWAGVDEQIRKKQDEIGQGIIKYEGLARTTALIPGYSKTKQVASYDLSQLVTDETGKFNPEKLRELIKNGTIIQEDVIKWLADYDANNDKLIALQKDKQQLLTDTMASSITDSIVEGFKNGYDSAADFADNFNGLMVDAVLNAVKIEALEEPIKLWYARFSSYMESPDASGKPGLDETEKKDLKGWWDSIITNGISVMDAALEAAGIDINAGSDRAGSTKGIAQASQDSVDELNGRMTAVQAYIYDIRNINQQSFDFEKESRAYDAAILSQLETIAENTDYCKLLVDIKQSLGNMELKGVKIKN
jgi:hypothetical protein